MTRPASAPPPATTTSPTSIPAFVPLSSPTTRRNSDDSREITLAATVWNSNPARICRRAVSCSFSRRISCSRAFSAASRSFSSRSEPLSTRRRSISAIDAPMDAIVPATESSAPWIGRNAKPIPPWTSRTSGLDENAMSTSVTARSTV
jgi:hypothetical protein